ncbi:MAG: class II fructose-bisphosphate aldolase, partial [Lachnospiraceae bacterium]|nr:class II fructose-bisphosphate aldolase [Lachnospiraceae bacterium]
MEFVMSELLLRAQKGKYAIPAIDVFNMESVNACFMAAEKAKSPVIIMTCGYELELDHIGYADLVGLIRTLARRYPDVPYCIHLDHGTEEECYAALEGGFPSVMYDGSAGSFEDNVRVTAALKKAAGPHRCVEAEVGRVGGEEGVGVTAESIIIESNPAELTAFLDRTRVDTIAVSIGNIHGTHGFVKHAPRLNFDLLKTLHSVCGIP